MIINSAIINWAITNRAINLQVDNPRCLGKKITMWSIVAVSKRCDVPTNSNTITTCSIMMSRQCHICDMATSKWHYNDTYSSIVTSHWWHCDVCSSIMTLQVAMYNSQIKHYNVYRSSSMLLVVMRKHQLWCKIEACQHYNAHSSIMTLQVLMQKGINVNIIMFIGAAACC